MAGAVLMLGSASRAALTAFAEPEFAYGYTYQDNSTVYSNSVNIRVQGGVGPYTYAWSRTSGTSQTIITNPTQSSTLFYAYITNGTLSSTWSCLVTDSLGATVTVSVPCDLSAGFTT